MSKDPLLTVAQLAAREGVSQSLIRKWVGGYVPGSRLPHYKAGGVKVRDSEYRAWLASRRRG